ncbi:MAG: tetratricopeptide repeat protein [Rudaea sp.]
MNIPSPTLLQSMQRASALLQAGNYALARTTLEQVLQAAPDFVEGHRLLAGALLGLGDAASAERVLRNALTIDPHWVPLQTSLGELLVNEGRLAEAEPVLRAAAIQGRNLRAALILTRLLNDRARPQEVLDICAPFTNEAQPDLDMLTQQAAALAALRRHAEAIEIYRRIQRALPGNPLAELNLASALDAAGQHVAAERAAGNAIGRGAASAEAHFVHARSLIALGRFEEAQAALGRSIAQRATFAEGQRNLAQLIWMRTGDAEAANEFVDAALRAHPDDDGLLEIKASVLEVAGDARAAHAVLAARAQRATAIDLLLAASRTALKFDAPLALAHAHRATTLAPANALAQRLLADAYLATGQPQEAADLTTRLLRSTPDDQYLLAAQTTAWRILDDPRHATYCDYAAFARAWMLDTPPGWSDLDAYLRDLAAHLRELHGLHTHPLYQSLRHGSQTTQNLLYSQHPVIRAFYVAIDGPIRRHVAALGPVDANHPLRRRIAAGYRIHGIWSVRLRGHGFHTNHVHPEGWLSSACYIALPKAMLANLPSVSVPASGQPAALAASVAAGERPGWLKFGEPGIPTAPPLGAEAFIRPAPGMLALFPSYFWHGTEPFAGDDARLTMAFDVVPA